MLNTNLRDRTRNIAIIAHVDHGKTTLVDTLMRNTGISLASNCAMDMNNLERERGITILAKYTSLLYNSHKINIVDTPGHHDFGGEVERILPMVDGVVLVVCATEGPMPQTKFVLQKALELSLSPIVVLNKMDRDMRRKEEVENEIFDLFCSLEATDKQLEYPTLFASGKNGWVTSDLKRSGKGVSDLLDLIIKHFPAPKIDEGVSVEYQV
jgi:GTP-binding protein